MSEINIRIVELKKRGWSDAEVVNALGLRNRYAIRYAVKAARSRGELPTVSKPRAHSGASSLAISPRENYVNISAEDQAIAADTKARCEDAIAALIAAYGKDCFASSNLRIKSHGPKPVAAENPYIHTPCLP